MNNIIKMNKWRWVFWGIVAIAALTPVNWVRLWVTGDAPHDATLTQFLVGTLAFWGVAAGLAYFLSVSAKGIKRRHAREAQAMQDFLEKPLTEIRPTKARIKLDEKAYGAVTAHLKEMQTVGYSAGTASASIRVAKGVTLKTGGASGKAVKDLVSVAEGELVITDKRVIFAGDRKSFAITFDDLLSTTHYTDGFGFSDGTTTYTLRTTNDRDRMLFGIVLKKVLSD